MARGFQFKHFRVADDRCGMKVNTDGIILGALAPVVGRRYLDIGTGSGLIALMLAQRTAQQADAWIDGVELDPMAASQAAENAQASPWGDRIQIHTQGIQTYAAPAYDVIVSNPPFFTAKAAAAVSLRQQARQTVTLSHDELLSAMLRLLAPDGQGLVILPVDVAVAFCILLQQANMPLIQRIWIHPRLNHPPKRCVLRFGQAAAPVADQTLILHTEAPGYSADYRRLTQDFYLRH